MGMYRVVINLGGFNGGPGVNVWHVLNPTIGGVPSNADAITSAFDAFYTAIRPQLQSDVSVTVPNTMQEIDIPSGQPTAVLGGTIGDALISGNGTANNAHFNAMKVQLRTGVFEDGRELTGGPFIGPYGSTINTTGTLLATARTNVQSALVTLQSTLTTAGWPLVVYRRPRPAGNLPARQGSAALVTALTVWDLPAVQRRRRQ